MKNLAKDFNGYVINKRETVEKVIDNVKCCDVENFDSQIPENKTYHSIYKEIFKDITLADKVELLLGSMNYNHKGLSPLCRLIHISRFLTFNRNLFRGFQLGAPGIGKSFIFESIFKIAYNHTGSNSLSTLFGNLNSTKELGLLLKYPVINFDELILEGSQSNFGGADEKLRAFFNNGSINRDSEEKYSNASIMLTGNLYSSQEELYSFPYNFINSSMDILENLTPVLNNSPMKDRIHALFPLWMVKKPEICSEEDTYGFNSNFLQSVFLEQREINPLKILDANYINNDGRNRKNILKTLNGLLVLLFPNEDWSEADLKALTHFSVFLKKLIQNELHNLEDSPEYCLFLLKLIETSLPFKISDISEFFPTFDRAFIKLKSDKNSLYCIPLTSFGEKMSKREFKMANNAFFHNVVAKAEVIPSDLFVLKYECSHIYNNKFIDISTLYEQKNFLEDIQDTNLRSILGSLIKVVDKLETKVEQMQIDLKKNSSEVKKHIRSTLIEIDDVKEFSFKIVESLNSLKSSPLIDINDVTFSSINFPSDKEVVSVHNFGNWISELSSHFNCTSSKIENQLLAYDSNNSTLKLINFYELLPSE